MAEEKLPPKEVRDAAKPAKERPEVSRRKFLTGSVATAGALALPALARGSSHGYPPAECCDCMVDDATASQDVWFEPWEWRVKDHPGGELPLVVTEGTNPHVTDSDQVEVQLFTYNGSVPGPTVRMGGDDVLKAKVYNTLGGNVGPYANSRGARFAKDSHVPGVGDFKANDPVPYVPDWQLAESLLYGPHEQHTTNLHTHGLHVSPTPNPDGTNSDNVMLRIIPGEDYRCRTDHASPKIPLKPQERVGSASYEFRLGKSSGKGVERHPPGTHWYHPHPHGATYDQVATGMAGLILVEGDVDEALAPLIARERPFVAQRLVATPLPEESEGAKVPGGNKDVATLTVNGKAPGTLSFTMRPGAWERWRVLNGSVDGKGYLEVMVLRNKPLTIPSDSAEDKAKYEASVAPDKRLPLTLMAFDGVSLVGQDGKYFIQDIAGQYQNAMLMSPANRADFLFQAPEEGGTYYLVARYVEDAVDDLAFPLRDPNLQGPSAENPWVPAYVLATIDVAGTTAETVTLEQLNDAVGALEVPELIAPIEDDELDAGIFRGGQGEKQGRWRVRKVVYSGWGPRVNKEFSAASDVIFGNTGGGCGATASATWTNGKVTAVTVNNGGSGYKAGTTAAIPYRGAEQQSATPAKLTVTLDSSGAVEEVTVVDGGYYPYYPMDFAEPNSMTIDGRKFDHEISFHKMGLGTAEQWTLDNQSLSYKLSSGNNVGARAADHPFHMHQNPFYVVSIYDKEGYALDWNYKRLAGSKSSDASDPFKIPSGFIPRWQDVVRMPRSGGRIVMRSRFWDYTGQYVDHCHILNHEDWGMMQTVAVVPDPLDADYEPQPPNYQFPRPSVDDMFWNSITVVSPVQAQAPSRNDVFCRGVATPRSGRKLPAKNPDKECCEWNTSIMPTGVVVEPDAKCKCGSKKA